MKYGRDEPVYLEFISREQDVTFARMLRGNVATSACQ